MTRAARRGARQAPSRRSMPSPPRRQGRALSRVSWGAAYIPWRRRGVTDCYSLYLTAWAEEQSAGTAWGFPARRVLFFRVLVAHRAGDDDVLPLLPVRRGGDLVLRGELHGIEHAQQLVEVAAGGHRVEQHQLDFLVGA